MLVPIHRKFHPMTGMEVNDDGNSVTVMIEPKSKSASDLAKQVGSFKPGQFLLIHSTADDNGTWLEGVRVDPDQSKPKAQTNP